MASREEIISCARRYIGTPFRHQGRAPGVALDCIGVLACIAKELGISGYDVVGYGRLPRGNALARHLRQAGLTEIAPATVLPADVYLMRFDHEPQHVALATEHGILHAYIAVRRVVEHRLDDMWRRRIVSAYRFPGVD